MTRLTVGASANQVFLWAGGEFPASPDLAPNALMGVAGDNAMIIITGIRSGTVKIEVWPESAQPCSLEAAIRGWDAAEEHSVLIDEPLSFSNPFGEGPTPNGTFEPDKPGLHRVRILARGRKPYDGPFVESEEEYEISIWPARTSQISVRIENSAG